MSSLVFQLKVVLLLLRSSPHVINIMLQTLAVQVRLHLTVRPNCSLTLRPFTFQPRLIMSVIRSTNHTSNHAVPIQA